MKRFIKNKDILAMQMEEESEERMKEMKEHFGGKINLSKYK